MVYKDNRILTASPAELTLMLYEGAIKFCNIAIMAIEKDDIEKANLNIIKAEKIITELGQVLTLSILYLMNLSLFMIIYRRLGSNISKDGRYP